MFHSKAKLIMRGEPIKPPYYLDETFDAMMFVGQHAMKSAGSILCHTFSSKLIEYYKINNVELGEFGCRALMAGTFGVPTIFIAGDDMAVKEARALVPNIHGATVKQSLGVEMGIHLSHQVACELVRKNAADACKNIANITPYFMAGPYTQEIRVLEGVSISYYGSIGFETIDYRTVRKTRENICELTDI
jgi:D-amino peptidase